MSDGRVVQFFTASRVGVIAVLLGGVLGVSHTTSAMGQAYNNAR